jgi:hypothetical protein
VLIPSILAIIFGLVSRSQIRRNGRSQQGRGMALAGIIMGVIGILITGGILLALVIVGHASPSSTPVVLQALGT